MAALAAIRHVFGPFKSTADLSFEEKRGEELRWSFFGVRSDAKMSRWVLIYDAKKRTFHAHGQPMAGLGFCRSDLVDAMLPRRIADMPVLSGKVVDILKARLSREEMARAIAQSIRVL